MKKIRIVVLNLILSGALVGCSTAKHGAETYDNNESGVEQLSSGLLLAGNISFYSDIERTERKILFAVFLSLTVEIPDTANSHIEKIAKKYNGYVNEIDTYTTKIRVKSQSLNNAIKEISELGRLNNKNISGQDVTEEYHDYKIRLANAEKSRERYLELLAKAENVEATLKVEKELERLNETIDLLKGKMNRINHLSDFSTITINLKQKKKPGLIGYVCQGLYHSIKWLFIRN